VVLSDSSDEEDETTTVDQPPGGDVAASSSRYLEKEEHEARLEAEHRSKADAERSSLRQGSAAPHGKEPMGETSAPPPQASSIPSRGWVECDAS
jgi:hypothetical protein